MTQRGGRRPVSALALLQQEASAIVQKLSLLDHGERPPGADWCPAVDVFEGDEQVTVLVELPGVAPESLRVAFRERLLVVSGERNACHNRAGVSFLCLERPHGRFERSIPLEGPLDLPRARATLGRGLLRVSVPRLRERRGREHVVVVERESE